jgi:BlaI family penicillinase repressor
MDMSKKARSISTAELKILEVLWVSSPLSANQVINHLAGRESWSSRTIKSLINRLLKKDAINYTKNGNRYFYYPILKKEDYAHATSQSLIHRLFGGKISPLVAHFVKQEKLSKEDVQELKAILQELESDD